MGTGTTGRGGFALLLLVLGALADGEYDGLVVTAFLVGRFLSLVCEGDRG